MRAHAMVVLAGCLFSTLNTANAQKDSVPHSANRLAWIVPVGLAASVVLDLSAVAFYVSLITFALFANRIFVELKKAD